MLRQAAAMFLASGLAIAPVTAQSPAQGTPPPATGVQIILLGTSGGPIANPERSGPASLLMIDGVPYEIDAGVGTTRRLAQFGLQAGSIGKLFITHHHVDHTGGLTSLLAYGGYAGGLSANVPKIDIYGPPSTDRVVAAATSFNESSQRIFRAGVPSLPGTQYRATVHVIDGAGVVLEQNGVKVKAAENSHFLVPSFGPDGKKDLSLCYRFDTPQGSVVFTGDTGPSDAVTDLAKGADVLVSEVLLLPAGAVARMTGKPADSPFVKQLSYHMEHEHLRPEEVGKIATRAGVKAVILSHIVAFGPDVEEQLVKLVHTTYSGPVFVGRDLERFKLDHGNLTELTAK